MIPLSIPHIAGNEAKYVKDCLDTGWVSSVGSYVNRFEEMTARLTGASHAVATVNGTAALHIALILAGVSSNDEVLVPTLTFIAPINTVRYMGANPVFMDCDDYLNMDPEKVRDFCENQCHFDGQHLINKKTGSKIKAMIPVHVFGHPINIEPLKKIAERYAITLIEDATESIGSYYTAGAFQGKQTGSIGDMGCFSYNGNKLITTGGGGMLVTSNKAFADKARYLTTQAKDDAERFIHHEVGYNYRLTNVQAAIGCAQMEQIETFIETKRRNFAAYDTLLKEIPGLRLVHEPAYAHSNYWFYTLVVSEKEYGMTAEGLGALLNGNNIQTRPVWELNHRQKPFMRYESYQIEKALFFHKNSLSLPCSVNLKENDIVSIADLIRKARA